MLWRILLDGGPPTAETVAVAAEEGTVGGAETSSTAEESCSANRSAGVVISKQYYVSFHRFLIYLGVSKY